MLISARLLIWSQNWEPSDPESGASSNLIIFAVISSLFGRVKKMCKHTEMS